MIHVEIYHFDSVVTPGEVGQNFQNLKYSSFLVHVCFVCWESVLLVLRMGIHGLYHIGQQYILKVQV